MSGPIEISGMGSVKEIFDRMGQEYSPTLMRQTVHAIARQIAKDAKTFAPVDSGDMKRNIRAERRKVRKGLARSDVTVKDPKRASGDNSLFYWRFVERGTRNTPEQPFIRPAVNIATANLEQTFKTHFGNQLEKMLARKAKAAWKKANPE